MSSTSIHRIGSARIKFACRYFMGDKPCRFSKEKGIKCDDCVYFDPPGEKALIIKLGAPGDVLRTTPLLIEIKRKNPKTFITWITEKDSFPLLQDNPLIDRLWDTSSETLTRLQIETFDVIFSLENAVKCASLATIAQCTTKVGYGLSPEGWLIPFNKEAETYLEMAVFDDVKKANTRTYQDLVFEICGYTFNPALHKMILPLAPEEEEFAASFARRNGISQRKNVIGINVASGARWPMKRWGTNSYTALIEILRRELNLTVILLGGPEEVEANKEIQRSLATQGITVIDARCDNPLRQFIALVSLCDTVVTGDTLALHIAVALEKNAIALFGPTSATEIELYGRGTKVVANVPCQCCYRKECTVTPNCMASITIGEVLTALKTSVRVTSQIISTGLTATDKRMSVSAA